MSTFCRWVWVLLLTWSSCTWAGGNLYEFDSPGDQKRFQELTEELRCLVCQNQSLADSNAGLAEDLRNDVYEMVRQGRENEEIVDFLVARYGDFVLYRPPVKSSTYLLWFGPFLLLILTLFLVMRVIGKRRSTAETEFSEDDRKRMEQILRATDHASERREERT